MRTRLVLIAIVALCLATAVVGHAKQSSPLAATLFAVDTLEEATSTEVAGELSAISLDDILHASVDGRTCTPRSKCCKVCSKGKACGNSCISRSYTCHKGRGCACNESAVCS